MTQSEALHILKTGGNVFLTGQPGAGKSYLTNMYIEWLLDNGVDFEVTASTGIAATHIHGKTLHSFAGLRNDEALKEQDIKEILSNSYTMKRYRKTKVLIVDEISMVSAQMLENVHRLAQAANRSNKPFGGIKVVFVGDFFQLPPVKGDYCFTSDVWKMANFTVCNIEEQHRTSDSVFTDILTSVRRGAISDDLMAKVRERVVEDASHINAVRLDTHNEKVDQINDMRLRRLTTPAKTYRMTNSGDERYVDALKKRCLSPEMLILKVGARVIFTKNDIEQRWVNGSQGEVVAVEENYVKVRLHSSGEEHTVMKDKWEAAQGYGKLKRVFATIYQLPLRLAWAITIHKSQGMTLDSAVIDVSRVFAAGQAYVAISRIRSLDGVYLQGKIPQNFLKVDSTVVTFYDSF